MDTSFAVLLKNDKEYVVYAERYNYTENEIQFYNKNGRQTAFYDKKEVVGIRIIEEGA